MEGEDAPRSEVSVPRANLPIDVLLTLGVPSRLWGPLRASLAHRTVVVEHFSRSPGIVQLTRSLCKHSFVVDEWWRSLGKADRLAAQSPCSGCPRVTRAAGAPCSAGHCPRTPRPLDLRYPQSLIAPRSPSPPALLILTAGLPRLALEGGRFGLSPSPHPGIWYSHRPLVGDLILVHLRGLPKDAPGCSLLRFMATPRSKREAEDLVGALESDRFMLDSERNSIMEQAMKGSIPVTEHEGSSILARARAEGVKLGMRKGLKQGREQGREQGLEMGRLTAASRGVLRVLAARGLEVTAEEEERIRTCRDLGILEAWIEQSLWVDSVDELFE